MSFLLSLLIVAAQPAAPTDARNPDAVQVFHCGFEPTTDRDVDGWPDGWTRKHGPNYPSYLPIRIVETGSSEGHYALRLGLNGGAAVAYSPPIEVGSLFSYVLEVFLKTEGLKHDRAYISLTFFDPQGKELETFTSQSHQNVADWKKIRLGPLAATHENAHTAVIGLHLELGTDFADLHGAALFDDVWLARLPHMTLNTNRVDNVYALGTPIEISCKVSGVFESNPTIQCELFDVDNRSMGPPEVQRVESKTPSLPALAKPDAATDSVASNKAFVGTAQWKPTLGRAGFYRARVVLEGNSGKVLERQFTLVVVAPQNRSLLGEFGWTLPRGDRSIPFSTLAELLPQVGVYWAKFPVWISEKDGDKLDELMHFVERLGLHGIEPVGLLVDPPDELRSQLGDSSSLSAAAIFLGPSELWYGSLEPALNRLSVQMHWWQLGGDGDVSFVGNTDLAQRIGSVKKELEKIDHDAHLGFSWRMLNDPPHDKRPAWDFVSFTADPAMTDQELGQYFPAGDAQATNRWVTLEPLPRGDYAVNDRTADLVCRMVTAKQHGAKGIFVPRPFDPQCGLMNEDGTPGELLLPWRTTALLLGGAEYLGSITLPEGSQNHIFSRDGELVMAIWNHRNVKEKIYLGDDLRQWDVWGNSQELPRDGSDQVISVGPLPSFIVGLNEPVVRWNIDFAFEQIQLPSVVGKPHDNSIQLKNYFRQGIMGRVRLHTPTAWQTFPQAIGFKLAVGEETREPFTVRLPFEATNGRYPVRVDVELAADREYRFSIYRYLEVGAGDVSIDVTSHLTASGDLEIEQYLTNRTKELLDFKCSLYVPNRRRLVSQVIQLGPERDLKRYRVPNGKELIGKVITLRAEEIGGERTYNFRFVAKE